MRWSGFLPQTSTVISHSLEIIHIYFYGNNFLSYTGFRRQRKHTLIHNFITTFRKVLHKTNMTKDSIRDYTIVELIIERFEKPSFVVEAKIATYLSVVSPFKSLYIFVEYLASESNKVPVSAQCDHISVTLCMHPLLKIRAGQTIEDQPALISSIQVDRTNSMFYKR